MDNDLIEILDNKRKIRLTSTELARGDDAFAEFPLLLLWPGQQDFVHQRLLKQKFILQGGKEYVLLFIM